MRHFAAPFSRPVLATSIITTALCIGLFFAIGASLASSPLRPALGWIRLLPICILLGTALFTVRGYSITPDAIEVHRLLWRTRVPRAGLTSVGYEANALRGSTRRFGNGGMFAVSGWFSSATLGRYRAFVTDPARTVVLRYADRVVVLSPSPPELFVEMMAHS